MNKFKKWASLLLAVLMLLAVATQFAACKSGNPGGGTTEGTTGPTTPDSKVSYSVSLKTVGDMPLEGVMVYVHTSGEDSDEEVIVARGETDANGNISFSLKPDTYKAELSGVPLGYAVKDRYDLSVGGNRIVLTSSLVEESLSGASLELGDIMYDFEVILTDGSKCKLSEVLAEKKMVMLNFWYTTCTYCIQEFPGMNNAYKNHKDTVGDDIEIIALNAYYGDTAADVASFKANYFSEELAFPMGKDTVGAQDAFGFTANPATVIIDRYGMISLIHLGAITESQFTRIFSHYTSASYVQQTYADVTDLVPIEKPNIDAPTSDEIAAAVNNGEVKATYSPETESSDWEYSWPFIVSEKDGEACIVPSNSHKDRSFATLHASVELKAGEAFMFDYFASTEVGTDILYVLVDSDDIYQISGVETEWRECCPWVANEDGVYDIVFLYNKDSSDNVGDDTVYLRNFRVVDKDEVTPASYIPREAATNPTEDGSDYQTYASVVYSTVDGYYHVGTADGPILLARLIYNTRFSDTWVSQNLYEVGTFIVGDVDYFATFEKYCNYAGNSKLYTYCSVTEELRMLLEEYVARYSLEEVHENTWLQLCMYYDAYGQNEDGTPVAQLEDPVKGLSTHSAYTAQMGTSNRVEYEGMNLIPRGYIYEFIPTVSGAYRINSANTDQELIGWIFVGSDAEWIANGDRILLSSSETGERVCEALFIYDQDGNVIGYDSYNVSMVAYMEAGTPYYIDIAYNDVYGAGSFTFDIEYIAETFDYFVEASPGYFTYIEGADGSMGDTIAGGIEVVLGDDGYYYHKKADGSLGSKLYADFTMTTSIFTSSSLEDLIDQGAFNFKYTELDHQAISYWQQADEDEEKLKELWGESYDYYWTYYQMEDIINGIYHGTWNLTAEIESYLDLIYQGDEYPERQGCVEVDEELAALLQKLMDKYTFSGVENSWTKLCYYYDQLGR